MTAENIYKFSEDELRATLVAFYVRILTLLPDKVYEYINQDKDEAKIKERTEHLTALVKEEVASRFMRNNFQRYVSVPVDDFNVLIDGKAQQGDLVKGDGILFTASDGSRKIYIYDSCDGYGMGAYDLSGQRYTLSYSHCAKIVTVIDKEIDNLPAIIAY
jgi:hypothetical protein